ncbi:potassium voltage-gated channel protein Shaw-like [Mizuhopecten yessoensis]|uniref:Potassium voltage-gated channel protein Shaw n=1 Tax=Mizuhopecten yessoensis TaxID=6573 RepID=A0A210PIW1_MIZYE|nr:potassium voltage-gated channel protein Shaw-like [Mizuhopecten yessoensis]OWF36419.1 Potassium voltage-gated channel protein Shaw [Mizuhopecten yessoensis]
MEVMKINLRGTVFITSHKKLQSYPDTTLASLTHLSENYNTEKDEYFFDRNPSGFHNVLDFYSTGKLHMSYTTCAESFREELAFWGIPLKSVNKCCWKTLYQLDEDMDVLEKILVRLRCGREESHPDNSSSTTQLHRLRVRIWRLLTDFQSSKMAKVLHFLLALVMSISILTYSLQTLKQFRVDRHDDNKLDSNTSSAKIRLIWNTSPHPSLVALDVISNGILTLEFALRICTCPSLKTFWRSLLNIIDLLSCVGIWLNLSFERVHDSLQFGPLWIISCVFGFLYSFRILRVLRLVRHNCGMQILYLSIKSSSRELCLLACAFGCFVIIFAGFIYVAELQANTFSDLFVSMWWSVITMTTVGYGDHVPSTDTGYVVGTLCTLVGILLIALPVAITSSNFHDFYKFNKYRHRHLLLSEKRTGLCSKPNICCSVKVKPIDIDRHVAFK